MRRKRWTLVAACAVLSAAIMLLFCQQFILPQHTRVTKSRPARPAVSAVEQQSPIQAGQTDAVRPDDYAGSQACQQCHPREDASYRRTGMGRSLAIVDAQSEPPNANFVHALSGRRFEVYRREGKLNQREILIHEAKNYELGDYPAKFVVGSGNHSRSYLMEIDGFLAESPLTWYTATERWGMSPGYDTVRHAGFRREVPEKCLFCHAGRAQAIGDSLHRIEFLEHAIGCERCHGPGAAHIRHHETNAASSASLADPDDQGDRTIVNPARLSRELAEDVCHQCHLTTTAYVSARGRDISDFRPGLPLKEFRHYFRESRSESSMRVVGHVDQLMLSDCYVESGTLSCLTCHDPHGFPAAEQRESYYREICLQCHVRDACQVPREVLLERSPTNDCVACHMRSTATDIPHMAFTDHRIRIHQPQSNAQPEPSKRFIELTSLHDLSFLAPSDHARALGLAYLALANRSASKLEFDEYTRRGERLLAEFKRSGLQDGEVDAALAQVLWPRDRVGAIKLASDALRMPGLSAIARVNCLYALAAFYRESQDCDMALPLLRQLTTLRRNAGDWILIGDCLLGDGNLREAIAAYEKALEIDPNLVEIHELLALCYERAGENDQAHVRRQLARAIDAVVTRQDK